MNFKPAKWYELRELWRNDRPPTIHILDNPRMERWEDIRAYAQSSPAPEVLVKAHDCEIGNGNCSCSKWTWYFKKTLVGR